MTDATLADAGARRVLHVTGSPTDERHAALSRRYARGALVALPGDHRVLDASPDGTWRVAHDLDADLDRARPRSLTDALGVVSRFAPHVALPQQFCAVGLVEVRALVALLGIPSVGNAAAVMALTLDKARARTVVAAAGVDVPDAEVVRRGHRPDLRPPVVVKPVSSDNSEGVALVRDTGRLDDALEAAWQHDDAVLVERYVPLGREVRCGTIERGDGPVALPLEEYAVDEATRPVRDAADKLAWGEDGDVDLVAKDAEHAWVVADGDPAVPGAQALAVTAHRALGCGHHGLVDVRIDPDGRPWFLEAGPYCSFAPDSVVVTMARAAGIELATLFDEAVSFATRARRPRPGRA